MRCARCPRRCPGSRFQTVQRLAASRELDTQIGFLPDPCLHGESLRLLKRRPSSGTVSGRSLQVGAMAQDLPQLDGVVQLAADSFALAESLPGLVDLTPLEEVVAEVAEHQGLEVSSLQLLKDPLCRRPIRPGLVPFSLHREKAR